MKVTLKDNQGYKIMATRTPVTIPDGLVEIKFSTRWDAAKYPHEQVQYTVFLDDQGLAQLRALLD